MILVIAITLIIGCVFAMWILAGTTPAPGPLETAVAYELAWERHDWATLFDLSAPDLRDGLDRDQFVAAKQSAHTTDQPMARPPIVVAEDTSLDDDGATVATRVDTPGGSLHNRVRCVKVQGAWRVLAYELQRD